MFYDGWQGLLRVMAVGGCAYVALIALLRISGKRTLATVLLSSSVALAEGVTALALLIGLQFAVTWTSVRSRRISRLMRSEPTLVIYRGQLLHEALRRERVTEEEIRQVLRQQGQASVDTVAALVLETDGSLALVSDPTAPTLPDQHPRTSPGG